MARLSVASTLTRPVEERADLSRQAIAIARRTPDAQTLIAALASYCDAISGAAHSEERSELASEMVMLASASGVRETELLGRRLRLVALLELGDLAGVDAEVEAFERAAEVVRQPLYRWYVPLWRGMRAVTMGRLADCEAFVAQAMAIGAQARSRNADILTFMLHLSWLMESGRAEEACSLLEDASDPESGVNIALFRVRLRAEAGRRAEAQSLLSWLAADGFARVVMEDTAAVHGLMWASYGAADLGDRDAATTLYARLQPFAHRFGVSGIAVATAGSVSGAMGRLAHVLGRWHAAEGHFRDAVAAHRRAGATLLTAHTLRNQAAMLFDRHRAAGEPGDRDAAEAVLSETVTTYAELGLEWRIAQSERLRGDRGATPAVGGAAVANTFRRDGDVWTVAYDGKQARVKDVKGLHDIVRLLAEPGREFHVLDLVAATAPGARSRSRAEDLHEQGHAGELIDDEARSRYQARLVALEQELDDADALGDTERAIRSAAERDALVAELTLAYGLGGRARRSGDPVERARSAVTWRIRSALKRLQRAHPALGHHLAHAVKTGTYCSYTPEAPTTWTL